jgi:hypothetical protein
MSWKTEHPGLILLTSRLHSTDVNGKSPFSDQESSSFKPSGSRYGALRASPRRYSKLPCFPFLKGDDRAQGNGCSVRGKRELDRTVSNCP